ncbi:MAG: hybrid sensor histidine kinase/response regulator [Myxococcota bacterium]|nr:hybrid sensor histidine kinase/response regulator [Myxococcota bacterium]
MRNLVGVFMGGCELLADELEDLGADTETEVTLGDLRRAGERARQLLARLSGLAALESIEFEVFGTDEFMASRVPRLQRLAVGRRLQVVVGSAVPPVSGSPVLFEAILADLVDNAARSTADGGSITVHLSAGEAGGALLSVSDDGAGMAPVHAAQAFEPFFGSDPGRWGLGLPMVLAAVEAMGGTVALETREGEGTTVRVAFPPAAPVPRPAAASPRISAAAIPGPLALVVDDDPLRCTVLQRRLEGLGVDVLVAGHPDLAPLLLSQAGRRPRLLVLPAVLTQHSSADVAAKLGPAVPGVRILAIARDGESVAWADATVAESDGQAMLLERVRGLLDDGA